MAYRFNPPPNWPIDDPSWTPPPGWQPDPSWGPAPEGWNFWIDADAPVVDEDATHVAGTGELDPTEDEAVAPQSAETAEYEGPDPEAGLAQQTPYEAAEPVGPDAHDQSQASADAIGEPSPSYGPAGDNYPQASPAYGQAAPDYGHASPHPGYGQGSPSYGQGWPGDYPAPGSPAPGVDTGAGWSAATGPGDPPQKGLVARFWWVGCLVLFLVFVLIVALIGGILLFGGADETSSQDPAVTTTQQEPTDEATSEEATTEDPTAEAADASPTDEATAEEAEGVTPTNLPTVGEAAEPIDIVSSGGAGTLAVSMEWLPAEELPSQYSDTVAPSDDGEYLVVTANVNVTEGQMDFYSFFFEVVTPYGGTLSMDQATYELEGSGLDLDAPSTFSEGEEYSIRMLFAPTRAGGMQLQYDNYTDVYTWDIAA